MTTPTTRRRIPASTAVLAVLLVLAVGVAVAAGAGWIRFGNKPAEAQAPTPATSPAVRVDLHAELAAFISKRAADNGETSMGVILANSIKKVSKSGTEYTLTVELDPLFIAAEVPKSLATVVGIYDKTATKVTVQTAGGQQLYSGPPPPASPKPKS